ncbi:MAG TPA: hypothetical protein VEB63_03855 [Chitinophagaceae bacterium]|nr:hypothetical protein [Chitinophagaceae bacterium]
MRKKIEKAAAKYIDFVKRVGIEVIQPFKERPSVDRQDPATTGPEPREKQLCATDLFSIFTADIIREKVTFTR